MSLPHENRREPRSHYGLHRSQQTGLVVDHDIVCGRIALLHAVEHKFLVQVHQTRPSTASQIPERSILRG